MTNEHTSLEKYTSHTLFAIGLRKGWCWLCVRGEWETEQTATYWPEVLRTIAPLLPRSAGLLNRGPEGPSPLSGAGSHYGILSPIATGTWTELYRPRTPTELKPSVTPGYIIAWRQPASCVCHICTEFNLSTGQGDIPISSTRYTCFLIDGSVEGQYVTVVLQCTSTHGLDSLGRSAKIYKNQLSADTGYDLDNLPKMTETDGKRKTSKFFLSAWLNEMMMKMMMKNFVQQILVYGR